VQAALETYSNVHRGSGHSSLATTHLFEQAREIVLEDLGLDPAHHTVVFCTPRGAERLEKRLEAGSYRCLSSREIGLPLGVRALAVKRRALPGGAPAQAGGGTARLVSPGWVVWAGSPDRYEAGTPAIINVIAFARALQLSRRFGPGAWQPAAEDERSAAQILYQDALQGYSGRELLRALRQTLIGRQVRVPTAQGAAPFINFDNGASTPTFQPVWEAVCQAWRQPPAVQQEIIDEVRSICAGVLGAPRPEYEVVFTANTTEAINLAAESLGKEAGPDEPVVLNTLLEHNSNELPWRVTPGVSLVRLAVDAEGFLDLGELEALLRLYNQEGGHGKQRIRLVAVSGASNVLGACNDLAAISRIAHRYGASVLVDGAQLVAHRRVEMQAWGIDYLAFSAHKAYAPFGSGALLARKGLLHFSPAEMEQIRASGEENAAGIAALGKALVLLQRIGLDLIQEEEQALTAQALRGMARIPGLKLYGVKDPDAPRFAQKGGVIPFNLKGMISHQVAAALAEQGGIGIRSGCHCAHLTVKRMLHIPPAVEQLQGLIVSVFPRLALPGVARVSLGLENSAEEVEALLRVLDAIARQHGDKEAAPSAAGRAAVQKQIDEFVRDAAGRVYA
jgi:selenocysteine lyase/cysteine desulfurase